VQPYQADAAVVAQLLLHNAGPGGTNESLRRRQAERQLVAGDVGAIGGPVTDGAVGRQGFDLTHDRHGIQHRLKDESKCVPLGIGPGGEEGGEVEEKGQE